MMHTAGIWAPTPCSLSLAVMRCWWRVYHERLQRHPTLSLPGRAVVTPDQLQREHGLRDSDASGVQTCPRGHELANALMLEISKPCQGCAFAGSSPEANAFVVPGGKVVVYTGLLKLLSSDDELAAVLAHEAAHVVARHAVRVSL